MGSHIETVAQRALNFEQELELNAQTPVRVRLHFEVKEFRARQRVVSVSGDDSGPFVVPIAVGYRKEPLVVHFPADADPSSN